MSAKDEILLINQQVSEVEKKIFETKIKQGTVNKELKKAESDLEAAEIRLEECEESYSLVKNEDIIDLNLFKQEKLLLENQLDIVQEAKSNLNIIKKTVKDIEDLINKLEEYKQAKKKELNNNYGQIKEFKLKSRDSEQA